MTEKEKNKYRLLYKLGGSISEKEYQKNACNNCKIHNTCKANRDDFLKFYVRELDDFIKCFCLDFIPEEKK